MKRIKILAITCLVFMLIISTFGCSKDTKPMQNIDKNDEKDFSISLVSKTLDKENIFTERDISAKYDDNIYNIKLADNNSESDNSKVSINNNNVTITNTGTYIINGKLTNGSLIVDADDTDKIQLVLNGVEINNSTASAINIKKAKKVFITLADNSENSLSVSGEFEKSEDNKADGTIYSKEDLTMNGTGKLTISSQYGHGLVCNDDLVITDGNYNITSAKHSIKANDSISFAGGNLNLTSSKDAVHCDNDSESDKGNIYIQKTSLSINCEDDAIHASGYIIIENGDIKIIKSYEGIEGQKIEINGGNIEIKSSDDGINASSGNNENISDSNNTDNKSNTLNMRDKNNPFNSDENCYINIGGGVIIVDADGDGIDSNGYIQQNNGSITVYGAENSGNGALDYGISAKINGGTIAAFGYSGMAQGFSSYSSQGSMLINFENDTSDEFILTDNNSKKIIAVKPDKKYNSVVFSSKDIEKGSTYIAKAGNQSKTIKMSEISYQDENRFERKNNIMNDNMPKNDDFNPHDNKPDKQPDSNQPPRTE
ncbi:MAG: carbohydrate-binding domain-containing protein [Acetobacter sp.]|nr:carbohydrate-binding domain-containing protein [Bacteroides sp.]MCM1340568.1 carbohydrate-binding domain-containing protein [Acetobacter sp.]MCM1433308.1 carbohydrate-binding domain-containing protein [Clostridiales bacterium]